MNTNTILAGAAVLLALAAISRARRSGNTIILTDAETLPDPTGQQTEFLAGPLVDPPQATGRGLTRYLNYTMQGAPLMPPERNFPTTAVAGPRAFGTYELLDTRRNQLYKEPGGGPGVAGLNYAYNPTRAYIIGGIGGQIRKTYANAI